MKIIPAVLASLSLCAIAWTGRAQSYTFTLAANAYSTPAGIAVDASGNFFVTAYYSHTVQKISPTGAITTIAGNGSAGSADGTGPAARFNYPRGLVLDGAGNLFVADSSNNVIRKITSAGVVTTFAGALNIGPGSADGTGSSARFNAPAGLAIDAGGNLFVADAGNHTIRKITPAGVVTTVAGGAGANGTADGTGASARFDTPQGVALDSVGNLFVADTNNHAIRKISPAGVVTTLAGLPGNRGEADGAGLASRFDTPMGIAVDGAGNIFAGDSNTSTLRKITPTGVVKTIGGVAGISGDASGIGANARFYQIRGIVVDSTGTLYLADSNAIKLGLPSSQPAITVQPQTQTVAAGSSIALTVTATGAEPFTYQWQKNGVAIQGATSASLAFSSVAASDSGSFTVSATNSLGTLLSASAVLTVVGPLANNNFSNAQDISGASGSTPGNNLGATGEPGEPTHTTFAGTNSSVWYRWTPAQNGTAIFDISGLISPVIAAYTGPSLASLTRVGQTGVRLNFYATAGTTYYLAVGSFSSGSRGNFTLTWRTIVNDNFSDAQVISGSSGQVAGTNNGASGESGEPIHVNNSGTATSVWYRWTAPQNGSAIFDTAGSSFTSVLAAYTGNALGSLTRVAQTENNQTALNRVAFNVTAGVTYNIAVGSYGFGTGNLVLNWQLTSLPVITLQPLGQIVTNNAAFSTVAAGAGFTLSVTAVSSSPATYQWQRNGVPIAGATNAAFTIASAQATDAGVYTVTIVNSAGSVTSSSVTLSVLVPPANDNFANAQSIAGLTGAVAGSNNNATGEPGEPVHWNLSGTASSVWYKWTAPANGLAVIDTVGSTFDTVMAIYTGGSFATFTRLAQDDDRGGGRTSQVSFAANSGATYFIAVGGATSGARGSITLNWQLSPVLAIATPPANQTVTAGGSATFSVGATGTGVAYQWFRNGVLIPGATGPTLTVGNVQAGADATYTVTITNSSGSVTSAPATLAVAAPQLTRLTLRNAVAGTDLLWSIAGGGGQIVTVGGGGTILRSADNGATWTPRNSGTTNWLVAVTYGAGQFIVVGDRGLILTSPDGLTWTPAPASGTTQRLNNVIFADGKFVAAGEAGTIVTSTDGLIWTPRTSGIITWLHGLAYNSDIGQFATSGQNGVFLYSSDAVNWNKLPITGLTDDLEATVAVTSYAQFVAIGSNGTSVAVHQNQLVLKTGENLTTWSADINPTGASVRFESLSAGAGALFASGEGGKIITATDAQGPWVTLPSGTTAFLLGGMYYNNMLYLVGENQTIVQSDPLYTSRLVNISTRGQVGTGANIMISGFVITGTSPKQVLVRATGPALGAVPFNLPGTLGAPVLTLFNGAGQPIAVNSGWANATNSAAIATNAAAVGAFPFVTASADSAILVTVPPGNYTAQVAGAANTTGLSLVEVYDTDPLANESTRAVNISTRGQVGTGANVLIAGFVINGASSRRVLIRAVGPGLAAAPFNLGGTLAEPQLALFNGRGLPQTTAGAWGLQPNTDEIRGAAPSVGAFPLPEGSKDSAMVITLLPGVWTVQVSGANSTTGLVLVEVYALP